MQFHRTHVNNVRWGTPETYDYCFDGIPENSIVAIGTVGGSPRKLINRERFEHGLFEMVKSCMALKIILVLINFVNKASILSPIQAVRLWYFERGGIYEQRIKL